MRVSQGIALAMATATTVVLLLVLAQLTDATVAPVTGVPKTFDYGAYLTKYKKYYNELEALDRAKLFYARTLTIFKTNFLYATRKINYYVRQNQFTDLSPEEVKNEFTYQDTDLKAVDESKMSPDTPADMFVLDEQGTPSNQVFEPMTRSGTSLAIDFTRESSVDFLAEPSDDVDIRQLLAELHSHSKLAQDMSRVIEINNNRKQQETGKIELEKAREANNVVYKPYVRSTNNNFDPSVIQTQGWKENAEMFGKNYAKFMVDDAMFDLDPYPAPVVPKTKSLKIDGTARTESSAPTSEGSILSNFMGSIAELKEYFIWDYSDVDNFDEEEEGASSNAPAQLHAPPKRRKAASFKYDIDWRKSGCISAIKSQDRCNSCATFASLDLLEFFYCRQMKTSTEFSVQYLVDCGRVSGLRGCKGGKLSNVGQFIKKNGLQLNSVYPYRGRDQQCPFAGDDQEKSYMLKPELKGWRLFTRISAWYKWLPKSPIVVGISMPSDFLGYSGGIHDGMNCVSTMVHAMLLVGSGKEDGKPFWLLKNSFAETWGEAGYFRLSKKAPIRCFKAALVAVADFSQAN